jgi:hypothetical protein
VARALKEKLTCSIEKCKQFSGFLKTVRQAIAVGVVISPPEHAQKKRNNDDEICVIDDMTEMERSETPREIGIHIRQQQKEKEKEKARSTRVLSLAPQNTPHTPRSTATRTPPHAHRKMQTKKTLATCGAHGLVRDIPWHSGRAFGT